MDFINEILSFALNAIKENDFAQGGIVVAGVSAALWFIKARLMGIYHSLRKWLRKALFHNVTYKCKDEKRTLSRMTLLESALEPHLWLNNSEYRDESQPTLSHVNECPEGTFWGFHPQIGYFELVKARQEKEQALFMEVSVTVFRTKKGKIKDLMEAEQRRIMKKCEVSPRTRFNINRNDFVSVEKSKIPSIPEMINAKLKTKLDAIIDGFERNLPKLKESGLGAKKGIVFYGPPGTGKSSLIYYLAKKWQADSVEYFSLQSPVDMGDFQKQLLSGATKSIVVVEDIDCLFDSIDARQVVGNKFPFADLLNALSSPLINNKIIVFTTNQLDKLDQALIRPGRIDYAFEVTLPNKETIDRLNKKFPNANIELEDPCSVISEKIIVSLNDDFEDSTKKVTYLERAV